MGVFQKLAIMSAAFGVMPTGYSGRAPATTAKIGTSGAKQRRKNRKVQKAARRRNR